MKNTIAKKLTQPNSARVHGRRLKAFVNHRLKKHGRFYKYISLDHTVEKDFDGHYVVEQVAETPNYNLRLLNEFCIREGKKPENLTIDELKKFVRTTR